MGTSSPPAAQLPVPVFNPLVVDHHVDLVFTTQVPRSNNGDVMIRRMAGNGNVVFTAVVSSRSLRGRNVLLYHEDSRTPVISMQEKLTSRRSRWQAFRAVQSNRLERLFSVKKVSAFRPEFEVFMADRRRDEGCNFKIRGSYSDRACSICEGNSSTLIAEMIRDRPANERQGQQHLFTVRINPNTDHSLIAALMVLREVDRRRHVMVKIVRGFRTIAGPAIGIGGLIASVFGAVNS